MKITPAAVNILTYFADEITNEKGVTPVFYIYR